jgi:hypothetical protein
MHILKFCKILKVILHYKLNIHIKQIIYEYFKVIIFELYILRSNEVFTF